MLEEIQPFHSGIKLKKAISKLFKRVKIVGFKIGIGNKVDDFYTITNPRARHNLLIVAPGDLSIPPVGWGAVETIINETIKTYELAGFEVSVLNSKSLFTWFRAKTKSYDVILLHVDNYSRLAKVFFNRAPIVGVTHYGLILSPNLWHNSYQKTIKGLKRLTAIGCLSPEIRKVLAFHINPEKLFVSSNGSEFNPKVGRNLSGPFIYLGKVEERKRQFEMFEKLVDSGVEVVFVGDIFDERVKSLIASDVKAKEYFPGAWDRITLSERLCEFRGLILISEGEADALVLYEAQMAGLPIFCNEKSIGAQNPELDWVNLINENFEPRDLLQLSKSVTSNPEVIAEYARTNYNWKNRNESLVNKLLDLVAEIEIQNQ